MIIEINHNQTYTIFRIKDDLDSRSDLSEIYSMMKKYIANGHKQFAIGFSPRSYFYPHSISTVVKCAELLKIEGGILSIIEANNEVIDMISSIDNENFISVFKTEEDMVLSLSQPVIDK